MKNLLQASQTRMLGLSYLGLAIAAGVGFTGAEQVVGGAGGSTYILVAQFFCVIFQVITAVGFFVVFRKKAPVAALFVCLFGLMCAMMLIIGLLSLNVIALTANTLVYEAIAIVLFQAHNAAWSLGGIFFGLWLVPMGFIVFNMGMSRWLGYILFLGGVCYLLSAVLSLVYLNSGEELSVLAIPATIGEVWMILYLLSGRLEKRL